MPPDPHAKVTIRILGWEKWQAPTKTDRREWVKLSTDIMHDPDFFCLTIEQRYLFLMLILYAGRVGPVFELCPSAARVLFKLRRSAVFQPLVDQGLIAFEKRRGEERRGDTPLTPQRGESAAMQHEETPRDRGENPRAKAANPRKVKWGNLSPEQIEAAKKYGCADFSEYLTAKLEAERRYQEILDGQ